MKCGHIILLRVWHLHIWRDWVRFPKSKWNRKMTQNLKEQKTTRCKVGYAGDGTYASSWFTREHIIYVFHVNRVACLGSLLEAFSKLNCHILILVSCKYSTAFTYAFLAGLYLFT